MTLAGGQLSDVLEGKLSRAIGAIYFRGVFRELRFDDLTLAVKKIVREPRWEQTARVVAYQGGFASAASYHAQLFREVLSLLGGDGKRFICREPCGDSRAPIAVADRFAAGFRDCLRWLDLAPNSGGLRRSHLSKKSGGQYCRRPSGLR